MGALGRRLSKLGNVGFGGGLCWRIGVLGGAFLRSGFVSDFPHSWDNLRTRLSCRRLCVMRV
jgi:hypothetical protein